MTGPATEPRARSALDDLEADLRQLGLPELHAIRGVLTDHHQHTIRRRVDAAITHRSHARA